MLGKISHCIFPELFAGSLSSIMNDQSSEEHELDNCDLVGSEPVQNMLL